MSHVDSGFAVKDLQALADVVTENCPQLEMVKRNTYRTWITDHGRLEGDTALPSIYQLRIVVMLLKQGVNVQAEALVAGVQLPADLRELDTAPWDIQQQRKLMEKSEHFRAAYEKLYTDVIGKDAEYVIKFKEGLAPRNDSYEIGCVPDPVREGEYLLMSDYFNNGNGLMLAKGVGPANPSTGQWGADLRAAYAARSTERHIEQGIQSGEYQSYQKTYLQNGTVQFQVETN